MGMKSLPSDTNTIANNGLYQRQIYQAFCVNIKNKSNLIKYIEGFSY